MADRKYMEEKPTYALLMKEAFKSLGARGYYPLCPIGMTDGFAFSDGDDLMLAWFPEWAKPIPSAESQKEAHARVLAMYPELDGAPVAMTVVRAYHAQSTAILQVKIMYKDDAAWLPFPFDPEKELASHIAAMDTKDFKEHVLDSIMADCVTDSRERRLEDLDDARALAYAEEHGLDAEESRKRVVLGMIEDILGDGDE